MNILYVTPYVPSQIRTRSYNLIRALVDLDHSVTLLAVSSTTPEDEERAAELAKWGVQIETFRVPVWRSLVNCARAIPTREPLQAVYAYHPTMERRLGELLKQERFDILHVEHLRAARLMRGVRDWPTVYDSVDCISLLFEQAMQDSSQWRSRLITRFELGRTRRYEAQLLTNCHHVVISSHRDKDALEELGRRYLPQQEKAAPTSVITNGVDLEYFSPRSEGNPPHDRTVIFTGKMSYHANVAAAVYFVQDVLPHIWSQEPTVEFWIVGKDPPNAVRQLAQDDRIQVTGTVDDLRPYLDRATVAVCPVTYAAGVQFKVLEAMAMGKPVVCTTAAYEGLDAHAEKEVLVADDPQTFAEQVLRACKEPGLAQRLAVAGRHYVETHHSWNTGAQRLVDIYEHARSAEGARVRHR